MIYSEYTKSKEQPKKANVLRVTLSGKLPVCVKSGESKVLKGMCHMKQGEVACRALVSGLEES